MSDLGTRRKAFFNWRRAIDGHLYADFHGQGLDSGRVPLRYASVRYEEQQIGRQGNGSLVARFAGQHGWSWPNRADNAVTVKLELAGHFREAVNSGFLDRHSSPSRCSSVCSFRRPGVMA